MLEYIEKKLNPKNYKLPLYIWSGLIINSRIRFHSFFRYFEEIPTNEKRALSEYRPSISSLKEYLSITFKYFYTSFLFTKRKKTFVKEFKNKEIFLLKTFAYKFSLVNGKYDDPFFKTFGDEFRKKENHLVIVDPIMIIPKIKEFSKITGRNVIPWYSFITPFDFFKAFMIQVKYFLLFIGNRTKETVEKELAQELIHSTTYHHLLFYFAFERISKLFNVKRLIMTFENNSWEKELFLAFRKNSPQTKIIGLQHSVLPESTLGMRFLPWEIEGKLLPDQIYTTGPETEKILNFFNQNTGLYIKGLCAFRYKYLFNLPQKNDVIGKNILVAVDAIRECVDLLKIIISLKDFFVSNDYKITLRFHPSLPYNNFRPNLNSEKLESFSKVSSNPLERDILESDIVIYWGSTVSLESGFVGNPLIHYDSQFPLSHDPLFKVSHIKQVVKDADELKNAILFYQEIDLEKLNQERSLFRNYIKEYFINPDETHFKTLMES